MYCLICIRDRNTGNVAHLLKWRMSLIYVPFVPIGDILGGDVIDGDIGFLFIAVIGDANGGVVQVSMLYGSIGWFIVV